MNKKYLLVAAMTIVAVTGASLGALSLAQTVTPLYCNNYGSSTVGINAAATLTATGGNGSYVWSGQNLTVTNPSGNQFTVSYPNPGTYVVVVTSAGQTASCNVNVTATAPTAAVSCAPSTQNVVLGQTAAFIATGGNGVYTWSSPDVNVMNAFGSGFSANFAATGMKSVTVSSAGSAATCAVDVLPVPSGTTVTPGLPNTGGGYGQ